jgi:NADH-quinone oxidoreductase subunit F
MFEKVITRNFEIPDLQQIAVYERLGGYQAIRKALRELSPQQITDMVKQSGLRGRGGAGFPTGMKWGFVPKDTGKPIYLCCNADESEPGTFKDRHIINHDPHQLIEGIMVSAYALGCHQAFIYIRGEMVREAELLERTLLQAREKGYLGKGIFGSGYDLEIIVYRGAGAYICGEETGLLESLEGKRGHPRIKPPFPAVVGLYGCPTVINNVETLVNVPHIVMRGPEWFASIGGLRNTGPKLYSISGHVNRPGTYELALGIPLPELLYEHCGGILDGKKVKGVIPGGSSVPILSANEIDVKMDFDSLAAAGTMLGSAGVIVIHEDTCMVKVAARVARFYAHESCGQCSQCREGTAWIHKILKRMEAGGGRPGEVDLVYELCGNMKGQTICVLSDACAMPIESYITKFRPEFDYHITHGRCMVESKAASAA